MELRPLRITYGDVQTRLRTDETLFNITGEDDWTSDDRKRFRNATGVLVNSDAAVTQGWVAKPPYSLLVNPLAPAPPRLPPGCRIRPARQEPGTGGRLAPFLCAYQRQLRR